MLRCTKRNRHGVQCRAGGGWFHTHVFAEIPKVGAKRIREMVSEGVFREEVATEADGWCEATALVRPDGGWVCWERQHIGEHAHHIWPEDRDRGLHDPKRGLWLCPTAHDFAHLHPDAARVLGLLRPDPSTT